MRDDDTHRPRRHADRRDEPHAEEISVQPVLARRQDIDLGAFLAAIPEERLAVLVGVVALDVAREDPARVQRPAIDRFENGHFFVRDEDHAVLPHRVQKREEEVEARR